MSLTSSRRGSAWLGIALMLIQLLAPALSQAIAQARVRETRVGWVAPASRGDWCQHPSSVAEGAAIASLVEAAPQLPVPADDPLGLRACGYCDGLPCRWAALPSPACGVRLPPAPHPSKTIWPAQCDSRPCVPGRLPKAHPARAPPQA